MGGKRWRARWAEGQRCRSRKGGAQGWSPCAGSTLAGQSHAAHATPQWLPSPASTSQHCSRQLGLRHPLRRSWLPHGARGWRQESPPEPEEGILIQLKLLLPAGEAGGVGGVLHQPLQRRLVQRPTQRRRALCQRHCPEWGWGWRGGGQAGGGGGGRGVGEKTATGQRQR